MAKEMRLIDANTLKAEFEWLKSVTNESSKDEVQEVIQRIDNAPTVDAALVVHGQWEKHPNMYGFVRCSECRDCVVWDEWVNNEKWKYCPNCGAKMDKGEEDGQS